MSSWIPFNILMLLLGGKYAIVVEDGDVSLHTALLTFGWQVASAGVKRRCIDHIMPSSNGVSRKSNLPAAHWW